MKISTDMVPFFGQSKRTGILSDARSLISESSKNFTPKTCIFYSDNESKRLS